MSDVHVVPNGRAWVCEAAGNRHESFDTLDKAIRRARELADQKRRELVIHNRDGTIREKESHR